MVAQYLHFRVCKKCLECSNIFHSTILAMFLIFQLWESGAAFGNAVVNAVLCWFYDGKKNAVVKVFTYAVFLFRFYSVVDNS